MAAPGSLFGGNESFMSWKGDFVDPFAPTVYLPVIDGDKGSVT